MALISLGPSAAGIFDSFLCRLGRIAVELPDVLQKADCRRPLTGLAIEGVAQAVAAAEENLLACRSPPPSEGELHWPWKMCGPMLRVVFAEQFAGLLVRAR